MRGWRVPSLPEMLTLGHQTVPGETGGGRYWTTANDQADGGQTYGGDAWTVWFSTELLVLSPKWGVLSVRPVHGGF